MRHATLLTAVLVWTLSTLPSPALAQSSGGGFFSDLGSALFGTPKSPPKKEVPRPSVTRPSGRPTVPSATAQPSPPATAPLPSTSSGSDSSPSPTWFSSNDPQNTLPNPPPMTVAAPPTTTLSEPVASSAPASAPASAASSGGEMSEENGSGEVPLHKRLSAFRESAFGDSGTAPASPSPSTTSGVPSGSSGAALRSPGMSYGEPHTAPEPATAAQSTPAPTLAPPPRWATPSPRVGGSTPSVPTAEPERAPALQQPHLADAPVSPQATLSTLKRPTVAAGTATPALKPAAKKGPASSSDANSGSGSQASQGVLFARQSPILSVETLGPRRIAVGKESSYEVTIQNSGQVGADQVVVTIDLPDWADVLGAQASSGATNTMAGASDGPRQFRWKVGRLEAKGREKLILRIVPRQSRPFDLAVKWDYTPVGSQAMIEVQEAKLTMELHGPREVLFGKPEVYRLELANTGNGEAENVAITLFPMGPGETPPATHQFGTLAAGERKAIEVELTARHTGTLTIKVDAHAENNVEAHLAENILIRRANLQVGVEAPQVQFVGTPLGYRVRVSNPGNAPAQKVQLTATLPAEAKYVGSTPEGQLESDRRKVTWTSDTLAPGAETTFLVTCSPQAPGPNRLEVQATAEGELLAAGEASTRIEAVANLAMNLVDPSGPVRLGDEAVYEIQVVNRGTKTAENVEVIAYFSHGIEPTTAEGGRHRIGPGQVVFEPLASVGAGQSLVLKIHARAEAPGNHIFRAELHCKPLGTRLVSEETTLFYGDPASTAASTAPADAAPVAPVAPAPAASTPAAQRPTRAPLLK